MKKGIQLLLVSVFCFLTYSLWAQVPSGYQLLNPTEQQELLQRIKSQQTKIQDMSMDFTQVKVMEMMKNPVTMKGKMKFKKPQSLRMDYLNPVQMNIAMNNGQWAIKEGGRINRISEKTMPSLFYVNQMLLESVQGTIIQSEYFNAKVYEGAKDYYMVLLPKEMALKKWFQEVIVMLNKTTYQVTKVTMKESDKEFTEMSFYNIQLNKNIKLSELQIK